MDWILAAVAVFNSFSMVTIYRDRHAERLVPPWTQFAYSLITTELAWVWLPSQVLLASLLLLLGAGDSYVGVGALVLLLISWIPLALSVKHAFSSQRLTREALQDGLGEDYLDSIPSDTRANIEEQSSFKEWWHPARMKVPGVEVLKDISYGSAGMMHSLDIYRPEMRPAEGCPVLLQIHGGAWVMGSKDREALPLLYYMASKGWICVTINYRLSPSVGFPTHLEDCKRALAWVKTEGRQYGINPEFVAVTGGSAGGHLASLLATTQNDPELQKDFPDVDTSVHAAVSLYGVYDVMGDYHSSSRDLMANHIHKKVIYQSPKESPALWKLASPIAQVRPGLPPFMVIQGQIDSLTTVSGARLFFQKLRSDSDRPSVYLELPGAEHAFDHMHSPRSRPVVKGIHRFLEWSRANAGKLQPDQTV